MAQHSTVVSVECVDVTELEYLGSAVRVTDDKITEYEIKINKTEERSILGVYHECCYCHIWCSTAPVPCATKIIQ